MQNTLSDDSGLKGEVGWSTITVTGLTKVVVAPASDEDANPDLSDGQWLGVGATVGSAAKDDRRYRAMGIGGVSINGQPGYLVAWIPMADLDETAAAG